MGILGWVVVGLVAGALATLVMPGKDPGGILVTVILGILGGLLGGFVSSRLFGISTGAFFDLRTWIIALIGSIVLLVIDRLVIGRRTRR
ncbi:MULTISPECIES: GlsB/YeaQ/YmgE family stress response membrane protein [Pseudonocardia]|jgi:uncharacterized membrane protein YeaQ/YmgE (transglycosylase-associated protein family)|uniref:Membrane protein YeaQ/YmgE (Transglycosylase-associated protein family) n=1 Tax=Pseudonocardia alni TaxID=33907 RepID=A0A852WC69_PSEA5|nr:MULTISPECIES: GlsB/YeaQ/YmgE family stress response membrane protein [Pseudonocardia]MCO7192721.1 GlsB/YeaQ/YmgE family stress response membrane protein [Pseudonocardia sp. McavD-2-B]NYG04324.1 putative membrane protein YeaQ/YmgE (transglycosylase-associated protein family) [Pseudonocardia antarctica]